jgi:hypothetical protein
MLPTVLVPILREIKKLESKTWKCVKVEGLRTLRTLLG